MVTRITALTDAQTKTQPVYVAKYVDAVNNPSIDEALFETATKKLYATLGFAQPQILWVDSPLSLQLLKNMLESTSLIEEMQRVLSKKPSVRKSTTATALALKHEGAYRSAFKAVCAYHEEDVDFDAINWKALRAKLQVERGTAQVHYGGLYWSSWIVREAFFLRECGLTLSNDLQGLACDFFDMLENSGWSLLYAGVVLVSRMHTELHRNATGELHHTTRAAIKWADGFECYFLNGQHAEKEWILDTANVNPRIALTYPNVESRRELRDLIGWQRILDTCKVKVVGSDPDPMIGDILECDLGVEGEPEPARFLRARCGTGRLVVERIDPEWGTNPLDVQARRWKVGSYEPEVRT